MGDREALKQVGAIWKPKPGGKSKGTGKFELNGLEQRFFIMPNKRKNKENQPDYVMLSSDPPVRSRQRDESDQSDPEDKEPF